MPTLEREPIGIVPVTANCVALARTGARFANDIGGLDPFFAAASGDGEWLHHRAARESAFMEYS